MLAHGSLTRARAHDTYREQDVANIEQHQYQVADSVVVVPVRTDDQGNGDKVVAQHLPMVLAALLDVDDEDLLKPKAQLREDVELVQAAKLTIRPEGPEILEVEPRRRGIVEVLRGDVGSATGLCSESCAPRVRTKPMDQKTQQYMTSQACSLKRVTSFLLRNPINLL